MIVNIRLPENLFVHHTLTKISIYVLYNENKNIAYSYIKANKWFFYVCFVLLFERRTIFYSRFYNKFQNMQTIYNQIYAICNKTLFSISKHKYIKSIISRVKPAFTFIFFNACEDECREENSTKNPILPN